jgi:RNA polymerase sigma factor (sigma-70 family)
MSPRVEPLRRPLDDRSFERLYRQHLPEIYRYVLRDVGNRADAEEVTQNAFLDAYRALGRGHTPEKPRAWLFGIAKNATRRRYRTLSRRPHEVELDRELAEAVAEGERPQLEELRDAVGSLSPAHQQVLFLREVEGLSYVEIAGRMDLSHAAVETLLFRARRALRGQLEEAGIRPAAAPVSRRRRLAGIGFLPAGLLRQLDRFALEVERSGIALKTAAAAAAAVILGAGITVAVVPLGAASEREQAVTMPKVTTIPADDATLFTSLFSANPPTDAAGAGAMDSGQGSGGAPGGKDNDSVVQTFAGEATGLLGGSGVAQPGAIIPAVSIPSVTTPTVSIPSVTTPTVSIPSVSIPSVTTPTVSIPSVATPTVSIPSVTTSTPTVTAPALPQVDVPGLPDVAVTTSALPGLP